jgi:tetratricopeptide (TPR) repeat protein
VDEFHAQSVSTILNSNPASQSATDSPSFSQASAEAYFNRGIALQDSNQFDKAVASYDQAIVLKPDYASAYCNRGTAFLALKQFSAAVASYDHAIALRPDYALAYGNRGVALWNLKRFDAAVASYDHAIALKPNDADAYRNRGVALRSLMRFAAAVASYDHAIALRPRYAEAYCNRGTAFLDLKQFEAAVVSFDQAIALKPDYALAYGNRGIAFWNLKQFEAAVVSHDQAIALKPDYAEAYSNRGIAQQGLGLFDAAMVSFDQAIARQPDSAESHFNRSLLSLLRGDFEQGWAEHEWRWRKEDVSTSKDKRDFSQPLWLGEESLQGKTILLYSEQGFGDTLQFCRYVSLVSTLGARVILEINSVLHGLMGSLPQGGHRVVKGHRLPDFDYHCPLLSLPLAFKTRLKTIPSEVPYLKADAVKIHTWQTRLGVKIKTRIGLVWSGNPEHKNDVYRSISLAALVNHLPSQFQYVCLQKEIRQVDQATLDDHPEILRYPDQITDFADTAALCELMDLVISVDTSAAHLAGALGKPVWVMLPFVPDWRWLLDRDDSPWYPSAKLYRAVQPNNWQSVFERVATDLQDDQTSQSSSEIPAPLWSLLG